MFIAGTPSSVPALTVQTRIPLLHALTLTRWPSGSSQLFINLRFSVVVSVFSWIHECVQRYAPFSGYASRPTVARWHKSGWGRGQWFSPAAERYARKRCVLSFTIWSPCDFSWAHQLVIHISTKVVMDLPVIVLTTSLHSPSFSYPFW